MSKTPTNGPFLSSGEPNPRANLYLVRESMVAVSGTVPSLDGLRAVSILLVMFSHIVGPRFAPGGLGVLVFFVISGFLITRLLFAEYKRHARISLVQFYGRRVSRLYPAILAYTMVTASWYAVFEPAQLNWIEPASALFYFANYHFSHISILGVDAKMQFGQFWSLSVEEHFYFAFPLLVMIVRAKPAHVLSIAVSIIVLAVLLRLIGAFIRPELLETHFFYFRTEMRMDAIAFGISIAAAAEMKYGRHVIKHLAGRLPAALGLTALLVSIYYRNPYFRETVRYSLQGASVAVIMCCILFSNRVTFVNVLLNAPAFVWVGKVSYSLYVWHEFVTHVVHLLIPSAPLVAMIVAVFGMCFIIAALSYYVVESPFRRWGHECIACIRHAGVNSM